MKKLTSDQQEMEQWKKKNTTLIAVLRRFCYLPAHRTLFQAAFIWGGREGSRPFPVENPPAALQPSLASWRSPPAKG